MENCDKVRIFVYKILDHSYIRDIINKKLHSKKRTALLWTISQVMVISYRRLGATYRSHPQGSIIFFLGGGGILTLAA